MGLEKAADLGKFLLEETLDLFLQLLSVEIFCHYFSLRIDQEF